MNAEYFMDRMCEELESSEEYIKNAFELRSMNAEMSKLFYDMSVQELTHATNFYNMYQTYHKAIAKTMTAGVPDYIDKITKEINNKFLNGSAELKIMHQLYVK